MIAKKITITKYDNNKTRWDQHRDKTEMLMRTTNSDITLHSHSQRLIDHNQLDDHDLTWWAWWVWTLWRLRWTSLWFIQWVLSLNILSTVVFLSYLDLCQVIITDEWRSQDINIPKIQWWAYYHINWSTEGYRRHWVENVDVHLRNRQNGRNTLRQTNPTDDTDLNWISKQTGVSIKLCRVWNLQNFFWNFLGNRS